MSELFLQTHAPYGRKNAIWENLWLSRETRNIELSNKPKFEDIGPIVTE